jgi:monofunctional biosynthetic peptidoglycan transglycosylase
MEVVMHMLPTVLLCLAALVQPDSAREDGGERTLFQFQEEEDPWRAVNDDVMGGVSRGGARATVDGYLEFAGRLSLENNGGFSSVRSQSQPLGLAGYAGLVLRLKGDGRRYYLNAHTQDRPSGSSWRADLPTEAGTWVEVRVPFSDFVWTRFGRALVTDPLDPAGIRSIGFTIADGTEGPFRLHVDWVKAYTATGRAAADLSEVISRRPDLSTFAAAAEAAGLLGALQRGTPLTVFAPTNDAFNRLPDGALKGLLEPEGRTQLLRVLLGHVATGRIRVRERQQTTLGGGDQEVRAEGAIRVGGVPVLEADLEASNGVLHILDGVLPQQPPPVDSAAQAAGLIERAIAVGVPLFNAGNADLCAAIYEATAGCIADGGVVPDPIRRSLRAGLDAAAAEEDAGERAWIVRRALDDAYGRLREQ